MRLPVWKVPRTGANYGLNTIRMGFVSILVLCVVFMTFTMMYLWQRQQQYVAPTRMEILMPKLLTGWNHRFERHVGDKWLVAVGKTGSKSFRPLRQEGYIIVYVPSSYTKKDMELCRPPHCVYLHPENQSTVGSSVQEYLPHNSYFRRLVGYLYAISHGAKTIYTRNVYNYDPSVPPCELHPHNTYTVMEYTLDKLSVKRLRQLDFNTSLSSIVPWFVYYKYILRHKDCKPSAKPNTVFTGRSASEADSQDHIFTVLDSCITSFSYVTFWGLIFHTFYGALGKIVIQKLVNEISGTPNPPNNFTDLLFHDLPWKHEENQYERIYTSQELHDLHEVLNNWECDDSMAFLSCILDISRILTRHGLMREDDMELINAWLNELSVIGYSEPDRTLHGLQQPPRQPNESIAENLVDDFVESNWRPGQETFSRICPHSNLTNSKPVIEDIGLIIAFNEPRYYSNIPVLEAMYRGYFKHIIYCGPDIGTFTRTSTDNMDLTHFIFIEAFKPSWFFFYECLMLAVKLNIDVEGFIQIGDDTLLNPWNLIPLPRDTVWLHTTLDYLNISSNELAPGWGWWNHSYGKPAVQKALNDIITEASFASGDQTFPNYVKSYADNSKNFTYIFRQGCDFMYIPKVYMKQYLKIGSVFRKHNVMVELAHATIAMGLQPVKDIVFIKDGSLWSVGERTVSWLYFKKSKVFLHPFKLEFIQLHKCIKDFLCDTYMTISEYFLLK